MKKVLYCLVIALLAVNSAFAFTAVGWTLFYGRSGIVSDYAGNGFAFTASDADSVEIYGQTAFRTDDVNGWVYDRKEDIYTVFTGFDSEFLTDENIELESDERYVTISVSFESLERDPHWDGALAWGYASYKKTWTGEGQYTLTPNDLKDLYFSQYKDGDEWVTWDGANAIVTYINVGLEADGYYGSGGNPYLFYKEGADGTFRFGREEQETTVPEPATYAYALTGLVSAFGLKRRIKK